MHRHSFSFDGFAFTCRLAAAMFFLVFAQACDAVDVQNFNSSIQSVSGFPVNVGNGYRIKHQQKSKYLGGVTIEYEPNEMILKQAQKEAELRLTDRVSGHIPVGGRIFVRLDASSIEAANTKWLEYIILKDGREILRQKGSNHIANVPYSSANPLGTWWNIEVINIEEEIDSGIELHVIHLAFSDKDVFFVSPPEVRAVDSGKPVADGKVRPQGQHSF